MRPFKGGFHGGGATAGQGHAKMPVAFERGNQRFEVAPPVSGVRKLCQPALTICLPTCSAEFISVCTDREALKDTIVLRQRAGD